MYKDIYITKENAVRVAKWLREKAQRLSNDTFRITFDYRMIGIRPEKEIELYCKYSRITDELWMSCFNFCDEINKLIEKLEQLNKEKEGS